MPLLPTPSLTAAQQNISWYHHLALFIPLHLGYITALQQLLCRCFAFDYLDGNTLKKNGLKGSSAHIEVTMGMPVIIYPQLYRTRRVKSLDRNIFHFVHFFSVSWGLVGVMKI